MSPPVRTLVVWCLDWPLVAAGHADRPAVVVSANRVVVASRLAREDGVRLGQRRREAQARCPEVVVIGEDPARDAREFEAVVAKVATFTPRVEVAEAGSCALPARAPARYFGGEASLAEQIRSAVAGTVGAVARAAGGGPPDPPCLVGVADGPFAARLAARRGVVVPRGRTPGFLAPLPVSVLGSPALSDLLVRLGVRTLGELGEVDEGAVGARFGSEGLLAHRRARGLDDQQLFLRPPPPGLVAERGLDPPADRADTLAFAAVGLAAELVARLAPFGLAATQLFVEAETEHGETVSRWWRSDRPLTARAMVDRVRWQLEGWLQGSVVTAPTAGVTLLRLSVGEVVPDAGRQLDLNGTADDVDQKLQRGLARVQGLIGHAGVLTAVRVGGRSPGEQVRLVAWGEAPGSTGPARAGASAGGPAPLGALEGRPAPSAAGRPAPLPARSSPSAARRPVRKRVREADPPWPGHLPSPSPALVYPEAIPVEVTGEAATTVGVTGRGRCTAVPRHLVYPGGNRAGIVAWAGPWPADERWWDPVAARRRARLQVLLDDGTAHLLVLEQGRWGLEATYD